MSARNQRITSGCHLGAPHVRLGLAQGLLGVLKDWVLKKINRLKRIVRCMTLQVTNFFEASMDSFGWVTEPDVGVLKISF